MPLIDDRYELLDVVASGGMATVWRARDTRLDRLVAVKRPHPGAPGDDTSQARMDREARAAAGIRHPNLITVHDFGTDDDGPYLVMELAEGPTLHDAMSRLHASDALAIAADVSAALAAIHAAGVVHRDVKPANVILSDRGALLTDFGIAVDPTATAEITAENVVVATPSYAAPEVMAGEVPSAASDVFALGVVVREMLDATGGHADAPLAEQLASAVSPDPGDRPTAAELANSLREGMPTASMAVVTAPTVAAPGEPTLVLPVDGPEDSVEESPGAAVPPAGPGSTRRRLLLALALLLVLLLAIAFAASSGNEPEPAADTTSTTEPVNTTTAPTTSTSSPTTTSTDIAADPVQESRDRLETLLLEPPRSDLSVREVEKLMADVDEAIEKALEGDRDEGVDKLEKVAEEIYKKLEGDNRSQSLAELQSLADALGLEIEMPEGDD